MRKILAAGIAATAVLSSCSMPWSRETPSDLPPPAAPAAVDGQIDSPVIGATWAVAVPDANPPAAGTGVVDPNPPTGGGNAPSVTIPVKNAWSGSSVQQSATGTVDDAEVKAAVDEIDRLFDGIAGEDEPTKK